METSFTSDGRVSVDDTDPVVIAETASPTESVTVTVSGELGDPAGTDETMSVGSGESADLAAELALLSDEDLIARYWTTLIVDDETAAEFAAITAEVRSRDRGLVPFLD
jgi:hypothetical protein